MSRVEVIVERKELGKSEERFSEWHVGYIRRMFVVVNELCMHHCTDVVSVVQTKDVFRVFNKYWREAKRVKEVLNSNVAIGICNRSECIDLSEDYPFRLIVSKYRLKKLMRVWRMLKRLTGDIKTRGISTSSKDGIVTLCIDRCTVDLYIDEAIALSGFLLMNLYTSMRLNVIWELYKEVSKAFDVSEVGLDVYLKDVERGFNITLDTCNVFLTNEEVLLLAYYLLDASLWQIETE